MEIAVTLATSKKRWKNPNKMKTKKIWKNICSTHFSLFSRLFLALYYVFFSFSVSWMVNECAVHSSNDKRKLKNCGQGNNWCSNDILPWHVKRGKITNPVFSFVDTSIAFANKLSCFDEPFYFSYLPYIN